jgi:hypothetical protein
MQNQGYKMQEAKIQDARNESCILNPASVSRFTYQPKRSIPQQFLVGWVL